MSEDDDEELRERVDRALARLSARSRNIFLLARVEHWTCLEIAIRYGMSERRVTRIVRDAMWAVRFEMDHGRSLPWWGRLRGW